MNLYDAAVDAYESGETRRHAARALLRNEIQQASRTELAACIRAIEDADEDDAEFLNDDLRWELEIMRGRVRDLELH